MALTPSVALCRPPDLVQEERLSPRNKTQLESTPNSIRSSSYIDYNVATPVEISKEQLAWAQKSSPGHKIEAMKIWDTQGDLDTEGGSSDKEFSNSDENFLNLKRVDIGTQNVEDSASVSTGAGNASQEMISKQSNVDSEETTRSNIQINPSKSVSIPIEHKSKEVTPSVQQEVKNNKENKGENELNPIAIETDTQDNIGKIDASVIVYGGEDRGIQEEPTNLQEGVTRGRESTLVDPRKDFRAPATTEVTTTTVTRKERHNEHSQQEEDCYTMDKEPPDPKRQNESPQAFNNKSTLALSKKKRDALKKKIIKEMQSKQQSLHDVLVVEYAGIHVTALQIQKPDTGKCALNKEITPQELTDEYRVTHSEDEEDPDQYDEVQKEEEEMRALSTRGQQENKKKKQQDDTTSSDNAICKSGIKIRSKSNKSQ
ncbi:uncharacterized protein LOC129872086 [Solanum dulcamara]|uniref:uncharacterized protein LOC129872086 n=1 Tax=Solanum dulcamara TaxID=45834 RepID=UPI0024855C1B|nr:uncharacterized protein LOC129872086 [Solanum dulcamara]